MGQKVLVSKTDARIEVYFWLPAKSKQSRAIHQFSRRAVWFRTVPHDLSLKTYDPPHFFGKIENGKIGAVSDVDELFVVVALHQKHASARQVVCVQKLAQR